MTITKLNTSSLLAVAIVAVLLICLTVWKLKTRLPFTPQEAALLRSQLVIQFCDPTPRSLDSGLDIVRNEQKNSYLRQVMADVRSSVDEGDGVSESLAKHPEVFDRHYLMVISQGDAAIRKSGDRDTGRRIIAQLLH